MRRFFLLALCSVAVGCSSSSESSPETADSGSPGADSSVVVDSGAPHDTSIDSSSTLDSTKPDTAPTDSASTTDTLAGDSFDAPKDSTLEISVDSSTDAGADAPTISGCADAIDVTASFAASHSYTGKTTGTYSDWATCTSGSSPKAYLTWKLPSYGNYKLDVTSVKPASDPSAASAAIYVRSDCSLIATEAMCNASAATTSTYFGVSDPTPQVTIVVVGDWFSDGFTITEHGLGASCFGDSDCALFPGAKCNGSDGSCITPFVCPTGTADCDRDPTNGCETNTTNDPDHCGSCYGYCYTGEPHEISVACVASKCKLACDPGWDDCNGSSLDGCEAHLADDGLACGACGVDCHGGVCTAGVCGPPAQTVTTIPIGSLDPPVEHLEVDAANVYALDNAYLTHLWITPKSSLGSTPTTLDTNVFRDFGVGGGNVYWSDSGGKIMQHTSGGTTSLLVTLTSNEDAQHFFGDGSSLWILEGAVATSPTTTPATVRLLTSGATSTTTLYTGLDQWAHGGSMAGGADLIVRAKSSSGDYASSFVRIPRGGGAPSSFGDLSSVDASSLGFAFTNDATNVYIGGNALSALPIGGSTITTLWTPPTTDSGVISVTTDGINVYFAVCTRDDFSGNRIYRIAKTGGTATEIAYDDYEGMTHWLFTCPSEAKRALAVDDTYLYWVTGKNEIRRIAK